MLIQARLGYTTASFFIIIPEKVLQLFSFVFGFFDKSQLVWVVSV